MPKKKELVAAHSFSIEDKIFLIRGRRVMIDSDLAEIYHVSTKILNRAVKRNKQRFPEDFMFQIKPEEIQNLRYKFGASNSHRDMRYQSGTGSKRNVRYLPYAFTEHGAVMLASVLNSPVAIQASIQIVRAFLQFRSILAAHKELAEKIIELEKKYDGQFEVVFTAIKQLMKPPPESEHERPMGF